MRERNEDNFLVMSAPAATPEIDGLFVVADGMGGHQAGDVASGYVVTRLQELFSTSAFQKDVHYGIEHADYFVAVIKEILEQCNEDIYSQASSQPNLRGMGTTSTVALYANQRLFVGHVGDSRAYLWREGGFRQLTDDHSWVAEQVRDGKLSRAEAASHPRKNVLTRSLGSNLVVRVDRSIHHVQPGDRLLLCTDGLTNHVSDGELQHVLATQADLVAACDWLVGLANQRGGSDNITVVIVHFGPGSVPVRLMAQRGVASGVEPEVATIAATLKIHRSKSKRRLIGVQAAQRLRRSLAVLSLVLLSAAATSFLVRFGLGNFTSHTLPASLDQLALFFAAIVSACVLVGIILGLILSRLWKSSDQDRSQAQSAPSSESAA